MLLTAKERSNPFASFSRSPHYGHSPSRKEFDESGGSDLPLFDLSVIAAATDNFSDDNKLGEGGFGSVFKVTTKVFGQQIFHD